MEITFFPDRGSNPGRLRDRLTLYRVAIKAGLYRKAVQVYHIPIPGDIYIVWIYRIKLSHLINDIMRRLCKCMGLMGYIC